MAFPAPAADIAEVWNQVKGHIRRIKQTAQFYVGLATITRLQGLDFATKLATDLANLDAYITTPGTPGLLAYARAQVNDPALDLAAEWTSTRAQVVATQDWLVANFPNTGGELRVFTFDVSKKPVDINLTGPQTTAFKSQLNSLIATVN